MADTSACMLHFGATAVALYAPVALMARAPALGDVRARDNWASREVFGSSVRIFALREMVFELYAPVALMMRAPALGDVRARADWESREYFALRARIFALREMNFEFFALRFFALREIIFRTSVVYISSRPKYSVDSSNCTGNVISSGSN